MPHTYKIKQVINELHSENAISIKKVQKVIKHSSLNKNLIYIKSRFSTLPESITKLKTCGMYSSESLKISKKIRVVIKRVPHEIGNAINKKKWKMS